MSDDAAQRTAESSSAAMHARDAAAQLLGIEIESVGPGTATLSMIVHPDMLNGHAVCHGGLLFTLADTACAHASNSSGVPALLVSAQTRYLRPARSGDRLRATAQERARLRRVGTYDIEITNQHGELLLLFRGETLLTSVDPAAPSVVSRK